MSEHIADCGCKIHVAQWTSKRKLVSIKYCQKHSGESSVQPPSDQRDVIELIEWLRNESEELMGQAIARRGDAKSMESASVEDLKVSQNIAEKMAGRKLPRTTLRDAQQSAKMNSDVASKLEAEAMKLSGWSDAILPIIKQRDETIARLREWVERKARETHERQPHAKGFETCLWPNCVEARALLDQAQGATGERSKP